VLVTQHGNVPALALVRPLVALATACGTYTAAAAVAEYHSTFLSVERTLLKAFTPANSTAAESWLVQ
jgi:hypothetical protein